MLKGVELKLYNILGWIVNMEYYISIAFLLLSIVIIFDIKIF